MKVDFHSHVVNEYTSEEAAIAHIQLADYHLRILKMQSKLEFLLWKILGAFFLMTITTLVLQDKGFISNALPLSLIAGILSLCVFVLNAKKDLVFSSKEADCVKRGVLIEKQQKIQGGIFHILENNKQLARKGNLLSKSFIFWILGLSTTFMIASLCLKIGFWLAIGVSLLALAILFLFSLLYVKILKKSLEERNL